MQTLFPFGFPLPTALYLSLYLLTLIVHAALVSYVLAGSGYVAVATAAGTRARDPVARVLGDWLPFGLGTAITAGVAPLLFLQILYKESFYTANLLLFHRWMAIVPVLVIGFYLLYLTKTRVFPTWPRALRVAVTTAAFACFAFTAWSWTDNHLIALDRDAWPAMYAGDTALSTTGRATGVMLLRLGMWTCGAVPIMALIAGWQLRHASRAARRAGGTEASTDNTDEHVRAQRGAVRRLALAALGGLLAATALGLLYARRLGPDTEALLTGPMALPYLGALALGLLAQAAAWIWLLRPRPRSEDGHPWSGAALAVATAGAGLAVLGAAVLRETVRLAHVDMSRLLPLHERAAGNGGMLGFLLVVLINGGILVWAIHMTRRGLRSAASP